MFQALFGRVEAVIQSTIDATVNRALMMLSFLVAAGLATAAIAYRLAIAYGIETSLLALAAVFALIGIAVGVLRPVEKAEAIDATDAASGGAETAGMNGAAPGIGGFGGFNMSDTDREMLMGLLSSAAPMLAPRLLTTMFRNIPALIVIAIVIYAISRQARAEAVLARAGRASAERHNGVGPAEAVASAAAQ